MAPPETENGRNQIVVDRGRVSQIRRHLEGISFHSVESQPWPTAEQEAVPYHEYGQTTDSLENRTAPGPWGVPPPDLDGVLNRPSSVSTFNSDYMLFQGVTRVPSYSRQRSNPQGSSCRIQEIADEIDCNQKKPNRDSHKIPTIETQPAKLRVNNNGESINSPDHPFHNLEADFAAIRLDESFVRTPKSPKPNRSANTPASSRSGPSSASRRRSPEEHVIAIMGKTGSGKSTFISKVAVQDYQQAIGHGLSSRTQEVIEVDCYIDGHKVVLVDTPGFDDTNLGDGTILNRIAEWLKLSFHEGKRLLGLIYMHDINEPRVGGSSRKNMTLFRKLTGKDSMENVILLTTKWNLLMDAAIGIEREGELEKERGFWAQMLADSAKSRRHDGTKASAVDIIREVLKNEPTVIKIQEELGAGKDLIDTEAGEFVNEELMKLQKQHQEELEALKEEMKHAEEKNKVQYAKTLKEHYRKMLEEVEASKQQQLQLLNRQKESMERQLQKLENKLEERKKAMTRGSRETEELKVTIHDLKNEIMKREVQEKKEKQGFQQFLSTMEEAMEDERAAERANALQESQLQQKREQQLQEREQNLRERESQANVFASTMASFKALEHNCINAVSSVGIVEFGNA
ncbi:Fc.00g022080.m01.CDS01 [Cosmosporella sp. VM-42]